MRAKVRPHLFFMRWGCLEVEEGPDDRSDLCTSLVECVLECSMGLYPKSGRIKPVGHSDWVKRINR